MSALEFTSNRVMNGTWGEIWVDDDYIGEAESGQATIEITYSAVSRVRHLIDGQKMTSIAGKGTIKLHHVRSNLSKKISDTLKAGKTPDVKIIMKLDDPDALGAERVALYNCKFDKAILMDWEAKKNTEESYGFTFEDWEFLDYVNA